MQPIMRLSSEGMLLKQPSGNRPNTAAKGRKSAFNMTPSNEPRHEKRDTNDIRIFLRDGQSKLHMPI